MMCQKATWPDQTRTQRRRQCRGSSAAKLIMKCRLSSSAPQLAQHSVMMAIIARFSNNLYEILQCWPRPPLCSANDIFCLRQMATPHCCCRPALAQASVKESACTERLHLESEQQQRQSRASERVSASQGSESGRERVYQRERTLVSEVREVWRVRNEQLSSYFTLH